MRDAHRDRTTWLGCADLTRPTETRLRAWAGIALGEAPPHLAENTVKRDSILVLLAMLVITPSCSTGKKLAAFSAAAGRFLLFPIGDRRCNGTRASASKRPVTRAQAPTKPSIGPVSD